VPLAPRPEPLRRDRVADSGRVLAVLQHAGDGAGLVGVGLQFADQFLGDVADVRRVYPFARCRAMAALPRSVVPPRSGGVFYGRS